MVISHDSTVIYVFNLYADLPVFCYLNVWEDVEIPLVFGDAFLFVRIEKTMSRMSHQCSILTVEIFIEVLFAYGEPKPFLIYSGIIVVIVAPRISSWIKSSFC